MLIMCLLNCNAISYCDERTGHTSTLTGFVKVNIFKAKDEKKANYNT